VEIIRIQLNSSNEDSIPHKLCMGAVIFISVTIEIEYLYRRSMRDQGVDFHPNICFKLVRLLIKGVNERNNLSRMIGLYAVNFVIVDKFPFSYFKKNSQPSMVLWNST
jgi:hypothetical protein